MKNPLPLYWLRRNIFAFLGKLSTLILGPKLHTYISRFPVSFFPGKVFCPQLAVTTKVSPAAKCLHVKYFPEGQKVRNEKILSVLKGSIRSKHLFKLCMYYFYKYILENFFISITEFAACSFFLHELYRFIFNSPQNFNIPINFCLFDPVST